MGYTHWSDTAYASVTSGRQDQARDQIFRVSRIDPAMDPKGLQVRESRDSDAHPNSNPIIVAFDVTGSMGHVPERFAREKLGGLMRMLVDRKYIADPQILFAAIGDANYDTAPFQVGQFESGLEMDMWLTRMWLEGGGGDAPESYMLAHYFAAYHTSIDSFEKRGKKGTLFTIGDAASKPLTEAQLIKVFGSAPHGAPSLRDVVDAASKSWEVFHIQVAQVRKPTREMTKGWKACVGDRFLVLDNADVVCALIGVVIGLMEGTIDLARAQDDLVQAKLPKEAIGSILQTAKVAAKRR